MDPNQPLLNKPISPHHEKVIQPLPDSERNDEPKGGSNPAIELIRQKVERLYKDEPDAKEEQQEAESIRHRSKHQQFMYELSHSGRSLAEIQTEWHRYYVGLSDAEKHQVWQEFYAAHGHGLSQPASAPTTPKPAPTPEPEPEARPRSTVASFTPPSHTPTKPAKRRPKRIDPRTVTEIKEQLLSKVAKQAARKPGAHAQSLLFGLSSGIIVVIILLFGFFNERFLAPFMTPSKAVSSTPIIIDPNSTAVGPDSEVVIPKINVEIPVVYDEPSIDEKLIEAALERGVVHYATTPNPGEKGNGVIFGHSANNILNKGKYKFAFVLLHELEPGDTFYLTKGGKRYVYKVFEKKIVPPSDVSVLNPGDKPATFTLITCDPPGTNLNRLVVTGEQISPDPSTNTASTAKQQSGNPPASLPGEAPTLWSRIKNWFSS